MCVCACVCTCVYECTSTPVTVHQWILKDTLYLCMCAHLSLYTGEYQRIPGRSVLLYLCVCARTRVTVRLWWSEDSWREMAVSFQRLSSGDHTHVIQPLTSHLTNPKHTLYLSFFFFSLFSSLSFLFWRPKPESNFISVQTGKDLCESFHKRSSKWVMFLCTSENEFWFSLWEFSLLQEYFRLTSTNNATDSSNFSTHINNGLAHFPRV